MSGNAMKKTNRDLFGAREFNTVALALQRYCSESINILLETHRTLTGTAVTRLRLRERAKNASKRDEIILSTSSKR